MATIFYGWASEASETILYTGRNHPLPLYHKVLVTTYIDTRVQKVAIFVEIQKVAKSVTFYIVDTWVNKIEIFNL